jgi:hypothetical protein
MMMSMEQNCTGRVRQGEFSEISQSKFGMWRTKIMRREGCWASLVSFWLLLVD